MENLSPEHTELALKRPTQDEYAHFYHKYLEALPEDDLTERMGLQVDALRLACAEMSEEQALHRYGEGKWSIKEVIGHVTDAERVFAYRLLCISRGDQTELPGFDENRYVAEAQFDRLPIARLVDDFAMVRVCTLSLMENLTDEMLDRRGTANGSEITVRALIHLIAAHANHHLTLLRERYGVGI